MTNCAGPTLMTCLEETSGASSPEISEINHSLRGPKAAASNYSSREVVSLLRLIATGDLSRRFCRRLLSGERYLKARLLDPSCYKVELHFKS
ncbi:hypothetical protein CEXT_713331 [Caerostris extrusa]|uniref:Uncharacterized protein n=1 Tax=Caerostris extrusa TaxID=172846 RepID=A0AAV4QMV3_CAEEX|nr:hypothetical protein CEXT_713331 [Caerostris extrusa]